MEKVLINRTSLLDYVENFKKFEDVPFPELKGQFGCSGDEIPVLKIKAASLDDQIRANTIYEKVAVMAVQMMEGFIKRDPKKILDLEKMAKELNSPNLHEKTHIEVSLFHKCVVQPQFSLLESVKISEALPEVVNRVASIALQLSSMESVNGYYQGS